MDLVLKGRGLRITDPIRKVADHKLSKLARLDPRVVRVEVEFILERNPRIIGSHRVSVVCETAKRAFRAEGAGQDVDSALDAVIERLERQLSTYRGKLRHRRQAGSMG